MHPVAQHLFLSGIIKGNNGMSKLKFTHDTHGFNSAQWRIIKSGGEIIYLNVLKNDRDVVNLLNLCESRPLTLPTLEPEISLYNQGTTAR